MKMEGHIGLFQINHTQKEAAMYLKLLEIPKCYSHIKQSVGRTC